MWMWVALASIAVYLAVGEFLRRKDLLGEEMDDHLNVYKRQDLNWRDEWPGLPIDAVILWPFYLVLELFSPSQE